jgi:hypothetical protein
MLAAMAVLLGACSDDTVAPPPQAPTGSLQPILVQDGGAEIVTAKERALPDLYAKVMSSQAADGGLPFAALGPLLNEDLAQFTSPGTPPAHEPAGVVAAHAALFGAFDDRKMTIGRVWRTPNEQTLEWTMTGTHARDWRGIPATHKPVAFKGLTLMWTKDDGSITDIHVYFDVALVKTQITGAGPKELLALAPPTPPTAAQAFDQTGSDAEKNNVTVVKTWLDALDDNKEADYLAAVADDVEIDTLENAAPLRGKEEAKKYYRATHRTIGQLDTTIDAEWGVAQFAVVEYNIDGEQLASITWLPSVASLPARDTQLAHFDLVDVCEIRGGKIVHVWRYDNPAQLLGSAPPTAAPDAGARPQLDAGARPQLDAGKP